MDVNLILSLVKANLGMGTNFRDAYLTKLIEGIIDELTDEKGITLDPEDANHLMFVVDLAAWRFAARDTKEDMPEHLKRRFRNLYVHAGGVVVV